MFVSSAETDMFFACVYPDGKQKLIILDRDTDLVHETRTLDTRLSVHYIQYFPLRYVYSNSYDMMCLFRIDYFSF